MKIEEIIKGLGDKVVNGFIFNEEGNEISQEIIDYLRTATK